jgi:cob(I)alamin adenosyltransferase
MRYRSEFYKLDVAGQEIHLKAKIYTKTGDRGQTSLVGGARVAKTHPRLDAYGTLDELNSAVGLVAAHLANAGDSSRKSVQERLQQIQNNLFNMGSHLACEDATLAEKLPGLSPQMISNLEADMDGWESSLPALRNFILPGGSIEAAFAHQARSLCRRAERLVLALHSTSPVAADQLIFLNRLSDWFFLLARQLNAWAGQEDVPWKKG